jgi:peptidoglycan hydrolase-like protein with peptidoglycan-binding domain
MCGRAWPFRLRGEIAGALPHPANACVLSHFMLFVDQIKMKLVLTICLLLIATPLIASAQTRAQIKEAERRLSDMGYWTGAVDGLFDPATRSALIAFQKWEGRAISGRLTIDELEAIRTSAPPQARELGYAHVEVDLDRQVLMLVNDDGGVRVLPTSTGTGKPFMDDGQTSVAYTPRGRFIVYDKGVGWESGPLGSVYYANYISGGVAIHGARNVPIGPASHGCIRIPMFAAREVSKLMKLETIVLVYDKVSFVSAKSWIENPKLKQAALMSHAFKGDTDYTELSKTTAATKAKSRSHRGD